MPEICWMILATSVDVHMNLRSLKPHKIFLNYIESTRRR